MSQWRADDDQRPARKLRRSVAARNFVRGMPGSGSQAVVATADLPRQLCPRQPTHRVRSANGRKVPEPAVSAPVRAPTVWIDCHGLLRRADAPTKALPSLRSSRAEVISLRRHATISCTGSALTFVRHRCQPFGWNNQPAPDALRRERETSRAAEFIGDEFGNYAPAITRLVLRNFHGGAAGFQPFNGQRTRLPPVRRTAPADRNPPLLFG